MTINDEKVLSKKIDYSSPKDVDVYFLKTYLRIDFEDEDNDEMIGMMLRAAKSFAKSYLRFSDEEWNNAPSEITIAILSITEHWYKNRGILNEDTTRQELPFVFSGILDIHRNWEIG